MPGIRRSAEPWCGSADWRSSPPPSRWCCSVAPRHTWAQPLAGRGLRRSGGSSRSPCRWESGWRCGAVQSPAARTGHGLGSGRYGPGVVPRCRSVPVVRGARRGRHRVGTSGPPRGADQPRDRRLRADGAGLLLLGCDGQAGALRQPDRAGPALSGGRIPARARPPTAGRQRSRRGARDGAPGGNRARGGPRAPGRDPGSQAFRRPGRAAARVGANGAVRPRPAHSGEICAASPGGAAPMRPTVRGWANTAGSAPDRRETGSGPCWTTRAGRRAARFGAGRSRCRTRPGGRLLHPRAHSRPLYPPGRRGALGRGYGAAAARPDRSGSAFGAAGH